MPPRPETRPESAAVEDYLEQIHHLIEQKGYARVIDIASNLRVSQASVTNMVQKLGGAGLLVYEKYRGITLTDAGAQIGKDIRHRHHLLTCLLEHLQLDAATIYADVEGMEHHISQATLEALEILTEELEQQPALLSKIQARLAARRAPTKRKSTKNKA